jgi:hypothetical protein
MKTNKAMLRYLMVLGAIIFLSQPSIAQPTITLEAFGGWLWTSKAGYTGNEIKVDDKSNYGVRAGVSPSSEILVEFEWNHTETALHYSSLISGNISEDVIMNYYLLGINKQMGEGPAVPYGLLNLGVMNMKGQTISFSQNWFTVGLGGGLKYYLSDHIGIRLQARLLLPMQFGGIGVGCGSGGCGGGVSTYTTVIQGDFTGGVILRLGGS